ncbi:Protein NirD [Sterolibacterium denitrificans]|uniref:siroheme decarboxylase n=1 Tax=Sterolibacterium denitrificans TaxID=157592 RepID=A0A7Z7MVN4_9PROT|nr:Lrp/AsnC family transcriptional regulator [Sterolibacterium denitrificans]SMB28488.1 Protein NirD [Sterolibacterium denitrificans]
MNQRNETLDFRLLNEFQRDFPLISAPYGLLAQQLEVDELEVLEALRRLHEEGAISRVGAVFSPRRIGASVLAALAVPAEQLDAIADEVSAHAEVNHNYEREHDWNLWFVATAPSQPHLDRLMEHIASESACPLIRLPLLEEFHIDLGFDLSSHARRRTAKVMTRPAELPESAWQLEADEQRLMAVLQNGLPLELHPYALLAERAALDEARVLQLLESWLARGLVKRFGVIVRHHELGWTANAMCVWDVSDAQVSAIGERLARQAGVTLCYRRARDLPTWRYNLYCMIHGRERTKVEARVAEINRDLGLHAYPHEVLFSLRRYKQRGARYVDLGGVACV